MSNHKDHSNKVSNFPGRKPGQENQPAPEPAVLGGDQGSYEREKCGSCFHWKKEPKAGLDQGWCMLFPPVGFPIPDGKGGIAGQMLVRPMQRASAEGCDQHDDGTDEYEDDEYEDDDGGSPVNDAYAAGQENAVDNAEEEKLVAFFRSPEGDALGRAGDYDNLSPAETAIRAIRATAK